MPYKYAPGETGKIILKRHSSGCGRFLLFFAGFIFLLVGTGMFLLSKGTEMPFSILRFVFTGGGVIAMYMGVVLPRMLQRTTPDSIIFDNHNGRVQVIQGKSDIDTAYIYYDEIEGFIVKVKSHGSSSGSSSSSRSRYSFNIYLVKKDGGQWELMQFGNRTDAEAGMARLCQMLSLDAAPVRVPVKMQPTTKYSVKKGYDRTELQWRNPLGWGPLALVLVTAFVGSILYILISSFGGDGSGAMIPGLIICLLVGSVFLFAIVRGFMKMVKDHRTIYEVAISRGSFNYYEKSLEGRERKHVLYALTDLHSISYTFDTNKAARKLFVYTHEQARAKSELDNSFSVSNILAYIDFERNLTALDMSDLTPVEALAVENLLQEAIRERGNPEVI